MKTILLLFACLSTCTLNAQLFLPFKLLHQEASYCNPNEQIMVPDHFRVYQTVNDLWDAPVDSTRCFSFEGKPISAVLDLSPMDFQRPLFIQFLFDSLMLLPDTIYDFYLNASYFHLNQLPVEYGIDCSNGVCTGFLAGVEIPDETGTGTTLRWYEMSTGPENYDYFSYCFLTERFGGTLRYLIFKLTLNDVLPPNAKLELFWGGVEIQWALTFNAPNPLVATEDYFNGTSYDVDLIDFAPDIYYNSMLFKYPDTTYPSSQNLGYYDVEIFPNKPSPQVINLIADDNLQVLFQPFTTLRGGLVEGDTLRHQVNFIANGLTMCLGLIIDLIFDDGASFIYRSGDIRFLNHKACFMFRRGSRLKIDDGATFHYGNHKLGILAIYPDARLEFGRNATLIMDGRMMLFGYPHAPDMELHIELHPGQKLVFTEHARLMRVGWAYAPVHLNVHMLGGELDDSRLSPADRSLIRRIYPDVSGRLDQHVHISPNPNSGSFQLRIDRPRSGRATIHFFTPDGSEATSPIETWLDHGVNIIDLSKPLAPGVYFLRINTGNDFATARIVVN